MGDTIFFDIVLLAALAGFLIFKLRSVLGTRNGSEPAPPPARANPYMGATEEDWLGEDKVADPVTAAASSHIGDYPPAVSLGLARIRERDPDFDPAFFLRGAGRAFEMVLGAYARGDLPALEGLLSPEVLESFAEDIARRRRLGERLDIELLRFKEVRIVRAGHENGRALISVRFVTEQARTLHDSEGRRIEGDPDRIEEAADLWTFSQDPGADGGAWPVVETRPAEPGL
jgi:predicted lipid-binding transport protein (Tim44 family)